MRKKLFSILLSVCMVLTMIPVSASAAAGDNWTYQTPVSSNLNGVCFGNSTFVAVGANGTILTSSDGVNWTDRTFANNLVTGNVDLIAVCYGNGMFMAVGAGGKVITSTNGEDWTQGTSLHDNVHGICYGINQFLAVGDSEVDSAKFYTFSGSNWVGHNMIEAPQNLVAVCYSNNSYVACDVEGSILTSIDGRTWSYYNCLGTGIGYCNVNALCYGETYVAVGNSGNVYTSTDSTTWSLKMSITPTPLLGVCYGNGTYVTVGAYGTILSSGPDLAAPTVTSISPTSGPASGGTTVTITGTGLTGATAVQFGTASATDFTVNSDTQITATSPASAGTVHVTVTTASGTSSTSSADQFTYTAAPTVTSISPASGPAAGGTSVTITGTGLTGATAVKFGTSSATGVTVNSATQITVTAPAGSGTVHVTVTTAGGTSTTSSANQFTYAPTVLTGAVTINGTLKYGEVLTAAYGSGNNSGTLSYQWKRGGTNIGTNSNTYTLVKDDIGQTLTCVVTSTEETGSVTSDATSAVAKADGPAVTGVSVVGCTVASNDDGKLTGVTAAMEYKKSGDTGYTAGTGSDITGLANGDYLVRVKETDTHNAGADSTFTVAAYVPPALTGTVTISGTLKYDATLTAAYDSGNNTGTLSYQWKRGSTNIGTNSNTYTLVKDDIDQTLTCVVTSTIETGSVTSDATTAVAKADGSAVAGVFAVGCTTSSNNDGKLSGVTTDMEYKKSGDAGYTAGTGSDITGLTNGDYLVRVKETDTHNAGADSTLTVAAYVPAALTGTVTISGTPQYGATLTATYVSGNNTGTLSYQWKRDGTNIGTNSNTYTLVKDDIDKTLTCVVTSTEETGSVTSDATAAVAKADGPAVTGVSSVGCTTSGNNDGKLTGVTADMEYKKSGDTSYIAGTGSDITGLANGDYLVRVKETDTHHAGADSTFTVDAMPAVYRTLVSITAPTAITNLANGTDKTASALGLPETVKLMTDNGTASADVNWDVAGCSYDTSKTTEQTFTVSGTVALPSGVVNINHVAMTTTIRVTVKAAAGGEAPAQTITGFLLDYSKKTVPYGTSFASLNLPDKIKAVGTEISNLWITVSDWVCSAFKPNVPGTYTFKAVLDSGYVDSGYVLDSSVSAPEIQVTIKEKRTGSKNNSSGSTSSSAADTGRTETKVDTAGNTATVTTKPDSVNTNGNTASIETTIPSVTVDNTSTPTNGSVVDTAKKAVVTINVPTEAIVQQLTAKKDVDLTVTVPPEVTKDAVGNATVTINANKEILEAAKENLADVTIKIKDADTQQLAYSWTFRGEDLAKSTVPIKDVNIAMSVHLTTEVPKVNVITPTNQGLVLSFDHSGLLPSVASVKFSALKKGFKPGQALYFYYYNPATRQIESLGKDAYTVDADGNVTVQISHCSDYVLLPKAARTITLDTRSYTMSPKKSYEIGVKLTGVSNTVIKAYSSTKGVANVTVLKNGNVKATGLKPGLTYIMIDVYDSKNKFLTHASIRLTVKNGVKESGNSARQYGLF